MIFKKTKQLKKKQQGFVYTQPCCCFFMNLLMVYINSERIYNDTRWKLQRKTQLQLAKHVGMTYSQKDIEKLKPELRDLVYEYQDDPDQIETELASIVLNPRNTLDHLNRECTRNMEMFLYAVFPLALWKRELDLKLNFLEEILLMELIPNTTTHPIWDYCIEHTIVVLKKIQDETCRQCSNPGKFWCSNCKQVKYCSTKCLKQDIEDKVMGHKSLECMFLVKKKGVVR